MTVPAPDLAEVLAARQRTAPYLRPTPLHRYPALDAVAGTEVWVKHENYQPVGAFKVRGGLNLISQLSADERERGVISASTGNHGQSIAFAAALFGVRAIICVPEQANPVKAESMRALGAELVFHGRDFDEAREHCEKLADVNGYRYIHSGNEPMLIAGVATATLEILAEQPGTEVIVVPVGGGSGAAGASSVARAVRPSIEVIGVQAAAAPAAHRSWQAGQLVEAEMGTFAEGLATRTAFELPQQIMRALLRDFVLVSEEQLRRATRVMIEKTRSLVEPAGAAALAAVLAEPARFAGRKVAIMCSGGNISPAQLTALARRPDHPVRRRLGGKAARHDRRVGTVRNARTGGLRGRPRPQPGRDPDRAASQRARQRDLLAVRDADAHRGHGRRRGDRLRRRSLVLPGRTAVHLAVDQQVLADPLAHR
jgi:threonine dehydratase